MQENLSFLEIAEAEKNDDAETNSYKQRATNYRTYEQMCKDI